jgi:flagellar capping protein FliD
MPDEINFDELPDEFRGKVKSYVSDLRGEAARYRTERNQFRDKFTEAETLMSEANTKLKDLDTLKETNTKLTDDFGKLTESHDRLRAAAKFGISEEAPRLQGKTYDEWETDAESLAKKFGAKAPGLPKDPAAGDPPKDSVKEDGITKAFRDAGIL